MFRTCRQSLEEHTYVLRPGKIEIQSQPLLRSTPSRKLNICGEREGPVGREGGNRVK